MGIIYKITCEVTGKSYIGKTIQPLKKRICQHRIYNKNACRALSNAIQCYNWENFNVSVLWEGDSNILGEMERKFISDYGTLEPYGYNIREGGGRSERVSDVSRNIMIEKQREISKRRNGLLGRIVGNISKKDGSITSWSVHGHRNGHPYKIGGPYKTREEAIEVQEKFTDNPNSFEIPKSKRVGNRKSSNCYYDHHRKKWLVSFYVKNKNVYLGRYDTEREALNVADEFRKLHFTPETYI